ncbi:LutC/YkgG family protein [Cupriavidus agavae]|uniref:L-lactate dehydrogenase complex protein LldG n=1 Tax=Cupriavidus agavae TaxID=1001822 RepID=A0A4Q7RFC9_9BURK|nr:lactate utilization protein [Cupriavidus agavae]RZT31893.1 L-lactate dehydrogenase complex protein LldG [Cupriavidus agavae]
MTAMSARERMLGRLRAAVPTSGKTLGADTAALDRRIDTHFDTRRGDPPSIPAMVAALEANLTACHADVIRADAVSWPALVAGRLAAAGVRRLLLDTARPEGAALAAALPPGTAAITFGRPIDAWKAELFDTVDAGFTVARSGLAATGTLVVAPDPGSPRTMSLVPPIHIALVHAATLHPDLHSAVRAEQWGGGMPTNLVMISGPSKTSDIQQTLAYGAHGPRQLWVVIVTAPAGEAAQ